MFVGKFLNNDFVPIVPPGWTDYCMTRGADYFGVSQFHNLDAGIGQDEKRPLEEYRSHSEWSKIQQMMSRHWKRSSNKPFFLYYAPFAPHTPAGGEGEPMVEPKFANHWKSIRQAKVPSLNEKVTSDKPKHIAELEVLSPSQRDALDQLYRERVRSIKSVDVLIGKNKTHAI